MPIATAETTNEWQPCGKLCKENSDCNYWNWNKSSKKCLFFVAKGTVKEISGVVSGPKSCARNSRNVFTKNRDKRNAGNLLNVDDAQFFKYKVIFYTFLVILLRPIEIAFLAFSIIEMYRPFRMYVQRVRRPGQCRRKVTGK